jgi:hypothetical protein
MKYLLFSLLILTSCGHYSDGTSVWAGGIGIIAWVIGILAAMCTYFTYRSYTSGSVGPDGVKNPSATRRPLTTIGVFWFAVILWCALIGMIIIQNAEK